MLYGDHFFSADLSIGALTAAGAFIETAAATTVAGDAAADVDATGEAHASAAPATEGDHFPSADLSAGALVVADASIEAATGDTAAATGFSHPPPCVRWPGTHGS